MNCLFEYRVEYCATFDDMKKYSDTLPLHPIAGRRLPDLTEKRKFSLVTLAHVARLSQVKQSYKSQRNRFVWMSASGNRNRKWNGFIMPSRLRVALANDEVRVMARQHALPPTLPPRLIGRDAAAAYVSLAPNTFDILVRNGQMPKPRILTSGRKAWDVRLLDQAIDVLPLDGEDNENSDIGWVK